MCLKTWTMWTPCGPAPQLRYHGPWPRWTNRLQLLSDGQCFCVRKEAIHGNIFKQDEELMWKNSKDNYFDLTSFFQKVSVSEFIFELWRLAMTCHDLP